MAFHYTIEERDGSGRLRRLNVVKNEVIKESLHTAAAANVDEEPIPRFSSELLKKVFLPAGFPNSVSPGNSSLIHLSKLGS